MDRISVRQAELADLEELIAWRMEVLRDVFAIEPGECMDELEQQNRAYYHRAFAEGRHIAAFAQIEGKTIGCAGLCLHDEMPSPDNPSGTCGYLMNVYVRETWRGQGAARALLECLLAQARHRGIGKVYLEATAAGKPLYTAMCFRDLPHMMILS
jgi:GNAT superfamily N-acetyltransferase